MCFDIWLVCLYTAVSELLREIERERERGRDREREGGRERERGLVGNTLGKIVKLYYIEADYLS